MKIELIVDRNSFLGLPFYKRRVIMLDRRKGYVWIRPHGHALFIYQRSDVIPSHVLRFMQGHRLGVRSMRAVWIVLRRHVFIRATAQRQRGGRQDRKKSLFDALYPQ